MGQSEETRFSRSEVLMIPIVTVSGILPFLILFFVTYRIYYSWRKSKSTALKYFLGVFFSFSIGGLIFMPNGILIKDPKIINLIFNIYTFFSF